MGSIIGLASGHWDRAGSSGSLRRFLIGAIALAIAAGSAEYVRTWFLAAQNSAVRSDISDLQEELRNYYTDNGHYPNSTQGLGALFAYPAERRDSGMILPKPSTQLPVGDRWGNSYFYKSDGARYVLGSYGPEGNSGHGSDPALTVHSPDIPR